MSNLIQLKPCVLNGEYICNGCTSCFACTSFYSYLAMEAELIEEHMREYYSMSEERRKAIDEKLMLATGKDKEIEYADKDN